VPIDPAVDVEAVLARLDTLRDEPREVVQLTGGLSNHSYRVTTPTLTAVLRIPAGDAGMLGVDREAEYRNTLAAHAAGIGPAVLDRLADTGVLVLGWLDGRTLAAADLHSPSTLDRVVTACRTLHRGSRFAGDVDLPARQRRYRAVCAEHGFAVPPGYDAHQPTVDRVAAALTAGTEGTVPCHNDLVPANMLDTGTRVSFVDYEYAANNDPCFELGNLADAAGLAPEEVVDRYYGKPRPSRRARTELYGVLAAHTWALWAAIRGSTEDTEDTGDTGDTDLADWGADQYARSASALTSARLPGLLAEATLRD
jgi:thiamine kinase-like enzyme